MLRNHSGQRPSWSIDTSTTILSVEVDMNAAATVDGRVVIEELPLDPALFEQLDENEAVALLEGRFRHFTSLGLPWSEALARAVGDRRAEQFVAGRHLSA
jgi:hypothetical protein